MEESYAKPQKYATVTFALTKAKASAKNVQKSLNAYVKFLVN